ncbi:hypothetical protein AB0D46_32505 [Streptomyces sp. NPDC048383]|uniref:hypothetical protein n=1 Tax=Streptomyces sp. NPDC048383 TaxID=3155386 RepID=UPI00341583C9
MGNARAYPVYRDETGRIEAVIAVAELLVGCGDLPADATVNLDAGLSRVDDVRCAARLFPRALFPRALFWGGDSYLRGPELPQDDAVLASLLPLTVSMEAPVASDLLTRAAEVLSRATWGQLAWMALSWPAVPELGLEPEHARTGVQACFNINANHEPATAHTVYAHVHPQAGERAQHLARQIGHHITGPSEHGW